MDNHSPNTAGRICRSEQKDTVFRAHSEVGSESEMAEGQVFMSATPITDNAGVCCSTIEQVLEVARSLELQVTSLTAKLAEKERELEDARKARDLAEAKARWIDGVNACESVTRLVCKLPPDILMGPMPFPDRLDYAGKMIQTFLDSQLAAARRDSERVDAIIANKWTITWNNLRDSFIVQSKDQVCGNIGHSKPLRELLDEAALPPAPTK